MNVVLDEINYKNIYFQKSVKNTIMDKSFFKGILYSTHNMCLNNICLILPYTINKYTCSYNKIKLHIQCNNILFYKELEEQILELSNIKNKNKNISLYTTLCSGIIRMISNNKPSNIILKVSGVWESEFEYGLTYKFINSSPIC